MAGKMPAPPGYRPTRCVSEVVPAVICPASGAYFKRYVAILSPLVVVVWAAANVLGNCILRGR